MPKTDLLRSTNFFTILYTHALTHIHTLTYIHSPHMHSLTHTHTSTLMPSHIHTYSHSHTSQLMAMGMTKGEITSRVKENAISESESIYKTLYGSLGEEGGMDEP